MMMVIMVVNDALNSDPLPMEYFLIFREIFDTSKYLRFCLCVTYVCYVRDVVG